MFEKNLNNVDQLFSVSSIFCTIICGKYQQGSFNRGINLRCVYLLIVFYYLIVSHFIRIAKMLSDHDDAIKQIKRHNMEDKNQMTPKQPQITYSAEHNGVRCFYCNIHLPRNDWKFDCALGFVCFYDIVESGGTIGYNLTTGEASLSNGVRLGTKLYKYFRKENQQKYKCASCFVKVQAQDLCKSLDLQLQGKGVIAFPQLWNQKKCLNGITITSLQHGTRISGHPDGKVVMSRNYQHWQKWIFQHISDDKYHLKSKTHGTYLCGFPDGRIEIVNDKRGWQTWIKKDFGSYHTWKSFHGNYLSCNNDGFVFLAPAQSKNQFWIDI